MRPPLDDSTHHFSHAHDHASADPTQANFDLSHPINADRGASHTDHNIDHSLHASSYTSPFEIDPHSEFSQAPVDHSHHHFSAHSQCDDGHPYVSLDSSGTIYKHATGKSYDYDVVGRVDHRSFYNNRGDYLGYVGRDGNVYDHHDKLLGWERGGTIYDKNGCVIEGAQHTSSGAIGAGCYLFFIRYGGVD